MDGRMRLFAALALILPAASATPQSYQPPRHIAAPPFIADGSPLDMLVRADAGMQIERDRSPATELAEHRKLDHALRALAPQRAGVVDAYVVVVALDSDAVFGREARAAADVLRRRFGAAGRTIVLAGSDGRAPSALPRGSPATLAVALARVAELMDREEDALILYTTSHGAPFGLFYHDGDSGYGAVSPARLSLILSELRLGNRLLIISACYSGVFVPTLRSETSAIVTAAASDRTSAGCVADNDWTFFGDAMINHGLRKPQPLAAAFAEAEALIANWEARSGFEPSRPQFSIGPGVARWLGALERRMPQISTRPVGRPAVETTGPAPQR